MCHNLLNLSGLLTVCIILILGKRNKNSFKLIVKMLRIVCNGVAVVFILRKSGSTSFCEKAGSEELVTNFLYSRSWFRDSEYEYQVALFKFKVN